MSEAPSERPHIGETLMSARPLVEYRAMFDLTESDMLTGPILDCPGGASSFAAEVRALGGSVLSIDPAYAAPAAELGARALADADRASAFIRENLERYVWPFFHSVDHHRALRGGGAERFAKDIGANPDHYVAAELPDLPFEDGAFRLALSSHLLFTYSDRLDLAFHVAACRELARVSDEARAYPLVDYAAQPYADLDALRTRLTACGVETEVRRVPYEFQRGATSMIVLGRN